MSATRTRCPPALEPRSGSSVQLFPLDSKDPTSGWLFAIVLLGWGFAAVRGMRRPAQPITARGGRPGPELWDSAGRALEDETGRG